MDYTNSPLFVKDNEKFVTFIGITIDGEVLGIV